MQPRGSLPSLNKNGFLRLWNCSGSCSWWAWFVRPRPRPLEQNSACRIEGARHIFEVWNLSATLFRRAGLWGVPLCGWTSLSRITSPMLEHSAHWSPRIKHCPAREMLVKPGSMKQRRCSKIQSKSGVYLHMNLPRLCTDYVAVLRTSSCFPQ